MSTIIQSIGKVRELVDFPKPTRPNDAAIYGAIVRNVQTMYNRLSNSGQAWAIDSVPLRVHGGTDTFALPAQIGGGKILMITTRSLQAETVEQSIPFFTVLNLPFDWNYPYDYSGGWFEYNSGGNGAAERIAVFFDERGRLSAQFRPRPNGAAEYLVRYAVGDWSSKAELEARPILAQFHHIFEIQAAKDVLAACEWEGFDRKEAFYKRRDLKGSLDEQEARHIPDFLTHIRKMTRDGIVFRDTD